MVVIFISLVAKVAEHLFIHFLVNWISFSEKSLSSSIGNFLIGQYVVSVFSVLEFLAYSRPWFSVWGVAGEEFLPIVHGDSSVY